jgi:FxLD family lantipeptide
LQPLEHQIHSLLEAIGGASLQARSVRNSPPVGGKEAMAPATTATTDPEFHLDVHLIEVVDPAGLVNMTDDNCGSTCGACTTNAA